MGNKSNGQRLSKLHPMSRQIVIKILCSQREGLAPAMEDYRAHFYETYRKEAEDYDKEFIKKYDEDLNTTLIFVSIKHTLLRHIRADLDDRLVCSPPLLLPSLSRSTPSSGLIQTKRPLLSSVFSFTRWTTPPSAATFRVSHIGLAPHTQSFISRQSSSQVSPLHSSLLSSPCSGNSG